MFSIIIPTYNQDDLLKKALESLIKQTFQSWEAIIINNNSQAETIKIIKSFNDDRLLLTNFNTNGVIAASRNFGINFCNYPYLSFLDSDDIWLPRKLEKTLEYLESGYDIVCHDEIWLWPDGSKKHVKYGPQEDTLYENLLFKGNVISTSATTLKKDLIFELKGFNENPLIVGNEDYDLWMRISKDSKYRFGFISEPLGFYRIHNANTSMNLLKQLNSELRVVSEHFKEKKIKKNPKNFCKLIIRIIKAIFGSLSKTNGLVYKIVIRIRK